MIDKVKDMLGRKFAELLFIRDNRKMYKEFKLFPENLVELYQDEVAFYIQVCEEAYQLFPKPPDNPEGDEPETTDKSRLLTPTEIGDALDLEKEGRYPRSDGGETWTINVDNLVAKQRDLTASILEAKYHPSIEAQKLQIRLAEEAKNAECDAKFRNAATKYLKKIDKLWDSYAEKLSEKDAEIKDLKRRLKEGIK